MANKIPFIYLASPYSHPDPKVREKRFQQVCEAAAILFNKGYHVYCPIAHSHPITEYGVSKTWEFWESYDKIFINICDGLIVLKLDDWDKSNGVIGETKLFQAAGKPISFVSPGQVREFEWTF